MLAIATNSPRTFTPIDWRRFRPITQAAQLMNANESCLRRRCRDEFEARGLAMLATPEAGGQRQWFVHVDADPRLLSDAPSPMLFDSDFARFTGKQRATALQRRSCLERLRQLRMSHARGSYRSAVAKLIERCRCDFPSLQISRSRLYAWDAAMRSPADLVKLIDRRGGDRRGNAADEGWEIFRSLYLHENKLSAAQCWAEVKRRAAAEGFVWCSLSACRQQLPRRIPPQEQIRHRNPATYRRHLSPFIQQHAESWGAGELWIGDHKQLDVICRWKQSKVRPWLTAWMDWRTRKVCGYVLSANPDSSTIMAALAHGLRDKSNNGGPGAVWIDNGRDYSAWMFHGQTKAQRRAKIDVRIDEPLAAGIFGWLQIEPHFALAYNPNGKARLERWFRTLESFCKTFDTYTGHSVDVKPERLAEILEDESLIPSFEHVQERIVAHIAGNNLRADHDIDDLCEASGERLSPDEAMRRWCHTRRVMADPSVLNLLLPQWSRPTFVTRNGVSLTVGTRTLHYGAFAPELASFKAMRKSERRAVRIASDPHDYSAVDVYDDRLTFIARVNMNGVGGAKVDRHDVGQMNREKQRYNRARRDLGRDGIRSLLTNEEHAALAAAESEQTTRKPPPVEAPMKIVRTPLDGQSKQIERAAMRRAVGAEQMSADAEVESTDAMLRRLDECSRQRRAEDAIPDLLSNYRD